MPFVIASGILHHAQTHGPLQSCTCPTSLNAAEKVLSHRAQGKSPSSFVGGSSVAPSLKQEPHVSHSVAGPPGPVLLRDECENSLHHPHAHVFGPVHLRRWEATPVMLAKPRLHVSQMNSPSSFCGGSDVCPFRCQLEQRLHSVAGPSGPGPFPRTSSSGALHQPQNHLTPPLHVLRWLPSPNIVSKLLPQPWLHKNRPFLSRCGRAL